MNFAMWTPVYIGIGSNLDDPKAQVMRGIEALAGIAKTRLVAQSKLFRSAPLGPQDQPQYVNAVVGMLTQLDASELLGELQALEQMLGRAQPVVRWGPRVIDFDLLVYGSQRIDSEALKVPHPGIAERAFVLMPLVDIAPDLAIPGLASVRLLSARCDRAGVQPL